jgi:hypothetical protein
MLGTNDKTMSGIRRSIEKLALTRYDVSWTLNDLGSKCRIMSLKAVTIMEAENDYGIEY